MRAQPIHLSILSRLGRHLVSAVALGAAAGSLLVAQESRSIEQDKAAIERLHQQDVAATFSDKADELANLRDSDAVRLQPGRPAEVGRRLLEVRARDEPHRQASVRCSGVSPLRLERLHRPHHALSSIALFAK